MTDIDKKIAKLEELMATGQQIDDATQIRWTPSLCEQWHIMHNALPELIAELKNAPVYQKVLLDEIKALTEQKSAALARAEKAEADRRWLAEQVVDALGKTPQGKYFMPPKDGEYPLVEDKETAIAAWVDAAQEAGKREGGQCMTDFQVQIVYKDAEGWECCRCFEGFSTESHAFEYAELQLVINEVKDAEIMVHKKGSAFWKVKDRQGCITQRPTTEAREAASKAGEEA